MAILIAVIWAACGAGVAQAYIVHGPDGRLYGILPNPHARVSMRGGAARAPGPVTYGGGAVMLTSRLYLVFWGPPGSFAPSYQGPITQWARDLAAESNKTTNEFSVASLYYRTAPRRQITRTVTFGGSFADHRPYPTNGCENPANPHGTCLSDRRLQLEVGRDIAAHHWPTDKATNPKDQYLIFTPLGVDSCSDQLDTSCTYSTKNGYCAYHSSFRVHSRSVVYSNMPYLELCDSGQAPAGVDGNADADGTLDSAIHEVLESATDPLTDRYYGWTDNKDYEIGDRCDSQFTTNIYGTPLGGSLDADTAFNQLIDGHDYYTQQIWARKTRRNPASRCVQRIGPSPVFHVPTVTPHAGETASFDGSRSYDLVGRIRRYAWSYGDGSPVDTSHGAHGAHVYALPGTYRVSLTVSGDSGAAESSTETQPVEVAP